MPAANITSAQLLGWLADAACRYADAAILLPPCRVCLLPLPLLLPAPRRRFRFHLRCHVVATTRHAASA